MKPDLVAPGEKKSRDRRQQARRVQRRDEHGLAPRQWCGSDAHRPSLELIGQPERIKSILCATATDLGRERYFQGHGLVDALRALQSV